MGTGDKILGGNLRWTSIRQGGVAILQCGPVWPSAALQNVPYCTILLIQPCENNPANKNTSA